jgi:Serine carboxypeptidase
LNTYYNSCLPGLQQNCSSATGKSSACQIADDNCGSIEASLDNGSFSVYDVRQPFNNPYPPSTYVAYLLQTSVQSAIGAKVQFSSCYNAIGNFTETADNGRSFLPALGDVVSSGVRVALIAGDAGEFALTSVPYSNDHSS